MMALRTSVFVLFAAASVACTASSSGDDEPTGQGAGGGTSASQPAPAAAAEYVVECDGKATKTSPASVDVTVSPKCINGPPGTRCGGGPCDPMAATFSYAPPFTNCVPSTVWVWDGAACVGKPTSNADGQLHCKGDACSSLYTSQASCESAHTSCMTFK